MTSERRALVLLSGGQDSTICLAWALARYEWVETVGFDYGQRHRTELTCRQVVRRRIDAEFTSWPGRLGNDHMLALPVLAEITETALTDDVEIALAENGLPNTFVPGRNLLFLALAGAIAYRRGLGVLVGGMCETDYSGYPDCREKTIDAMAMALNYGMDAGFRIETPLMRLTKADTWKLAADLGGRRFVDLVVSDTHTCYLGQRTTLHDWGYGCASCPACELRAKGYAEWVEQGA